MPTVRPFKPGWLVLTYLIPLLVLWDGLVSCLRVYSTRELRALVAEPSQRLLVGDRASAARGHVLPFNVLSVLLLTPLVRSLTWEQRACPVRTTAGRSARTRVKAAGACTCWAHPFDASAVVDEAGSLATRCQRSRAVRYAQAILGPELLAQAPVAGNVPFEGAGAISRWRIELPQRFRAFDYDTISGLEPSDVGAVLDAFGVSLSGALRAALEQFGRQLRGYVIAKRSGLRSPRVTRFEGLAIHAGCSRPTLLLEASQHRSRIRSSVRAEEIFRWPEVALTLRNWE